MPAKVAYVYEYDSPSGVLQEVPRSVTPLMKSLHAFQASEIGDLTVRQAMILLLIPTQPVSVKELAEIIGISKPAVTRALDRLEQLNLARRDADRQDRRKIALRLTHAGSEMRDSALACVAAPGKRR